MDLKSINIGNERIGMDAKNEELGEVAEAAARAFLAENVMDETRMVEFMAGAVWHAALAQPPSDTIAVPRSEWDELQRYKCMWASGLTIKSTGLRGQESGAKPIGYAREDLQDIFQSGYGFSNISNARSNLYCRGVYLAPTSAPAIEAAAIMRAAEVCKRKASATPEGISWLQECEFEILALTPQDGQTALEEFGMKVAEQVAKNSQDGSLWDSELRTIVTNLIGVPPGEGREE